MIHKTIKSLGFILIITLFLSGILAVETHIRETTSDFNGINNTGYLNSSGESYFTGLLMLNGFSVLVTDNESDLNVNNSNSTHYWDNLNSPSDITGLGDSNINSLSWSKLAGYPSACPVGSYLTQLDDSVTCTAAVRTTGENMTNDYNITGDLTLNKASGKTVLRIDTIGSNASLELTEKGFATGFSWSYDDSLTQLNLHGISSGVIDNTLLTFERFLGGNMYSFMDWEFNNKDIGNVDDASIDKLTIDDWVDMSNNNITDVQCIVFNSGGSICTG